MTLSRFILALGAVTTVPAILMSIKGGFRWGFPDIVPHSQNRSVIFNAWLANSPQVLLSLCYLLLNNICTCMASTAEWNQLGHTRKGLRVTKPHGEQRESYFLQLPYRYAVPLMLSSVLLHWLLSRALFLQRTDSYRGDGTLATGVSRCHYSILDVIILLTIAFALLIVVACVGLLPMQEKLPPAASCSLAISAACHPPKTEVDAHLKKVKWGALRGLDAEGFGHCCLTSGRVTKPEVGARYR